MQTHTVRAANGHAGHQERIEATELILQVALKLHGEPNKALSRAGELRFGTRGSLSVDLKRGVWFDHEEGAGGGVLDLIERETGLKGSHRLDWLRDKGLLGVTPNGNVNEHSKANGQAEPKGNERCEADRNLAFARRIASDSIEIKGTAAQSYLQLRGVDVGRLPPTALRDLLFYPGDLRGRQPPALVARVRNLASGELTGSIHRTPVNPDGTRTRGRDGKLATKKGLGQHGEGMILIGEIPNGSPVFIAEGIEDALTAVTLTGAAAIATLGASRLLKMRLKKGTQVVLLAQQKTNDDRLNWIKAAQHLATRGIEVQIVWPGSRGDINELLTADGPDAVRAAIANSEVVVANTPVVCESDDADLNAMNERFAVVMMGGKTKVFSMEESAMFAGCRVPVFSSIPDHCAFHKNPRKTIIGEAGHPRQVGIGKWWIEHAERRQYDGIVYAPGATEETIRGKLNLWTGFSCEPRPGICDRYLAHLRQNICNGHEGHNEYLLNWMAYAVQHPKRQGEVAVVLRGKKGVGKGVAIKCFGMLFGSHFRHISQPGHLTGHFNAHLQQCSVLFADEAFFAGDRAHENILKALITEESLMIEPKGIDPFPVTNRLHIILSSNNEWVVPAGADARRYFVLAVADTHQQDHSYFAAIEKEMLDGGREALLHTLMNRDISKFNVRNVPHTEALADQKTRSRRGVDRLVEHLAQEGLLLGAHSKYPNVAVTTNESKGEGFFAEAKKLVRDLKHTSSIVIRKTLKDEWGCEDWHSGNQRGIQFPALGELREMFDRKHGDQHWSETGDIDWSSPSSPGPELGR